MRKLLVISLMLLSTFVVEAAHLVGGEITYECLGNDRYRIDLRIYRDCNSSGANFDPLAAVTIFDSNGNIVQNLDVPHGAIFQLPTSVNNPCLQSPPNVCTEYTDYTITVTLPPRAGGYTITHQRCCRNNTISNIPNSGDWGNTYTVSIPSNDQCNSTPVFATEPPIVLCLNDPLFIDSSVNEPDGDSIHYELCSPLHGGGTNQPPTGSDCLTCPAPDPAGAPPYQPVPFVAGRSATNPIPSSPQVTINPQTGEITGTPTQLGQFVFAVCVQEFRNGQLLSTVRRDYQFNVTNCSSNVRSGIELQIVNPGTICVGRTIQFEEDAVNATEYWWDFGDPATNSDTSTSPNPVYTYSDTGVFTVTLIVNRGYPCADTATAQFEIRYPVQFTISQNGNTCFDAQGIDFFANGNFSPDAVFSWVFPPQANIQTSNSPNPPPISFTAPGTYVIELAVEDFGCTDTLRVPISIGLRPEFEATPPLGGQCAPYELDLNHSATATEQVFYEWDFGDGNTSSAIDPQYVYNSPGTYSGSLLMYTTAGCIDSAFYPYTITVFPSPDIDIWITPEKTDIFEPFVRIFIDGVDNDETFVVYSGDGASYSNRTEILHRYGDTGTYEISVEVENNFGCVVEKIVPFRVAPIPLIYTPTAFTPNGDGVNDRFRAVSSGYSQYRFEIFDRWGNTVFSSGDAQESWDGTFQNGGRECEDGAYAWIVMFRSTEGEYIERRGTVTLMR
ncbi:PKD domain-containing protein [Phaeocystidibacter luteus]|uniref:PKD domain-containing protein n=1 Tax=Phaeocystidibacter luteus TaxID=911197 RepID=A0A6N6RHY4_9FLAO|nr:PKD domain-containing protein [Phaeocystidibacter luteus]KAB2810377.1 PKD domain-containing protein [Phaeocystidibacter luteus]